jgi:hypothetical protein
MKNKAHDVRHWAFLPSDRILPDANFWINVFGPAATAGPRKNRAVHYSNAFLAILTKGAQLYVDVLILSEFVNALARHEFNTRFSTKYGAGGFKAYRNSADFVPTARMIARETRKILARSTRLDHSLTEWDFSRLLVDFENGSEDFNDQLIVEMARKHSLCLLTDDGDMTLGGLTVLTANQRLISACPP